MNASLNTNFALPAFSGSVVPGLRTDVIPPVGMNAYSNFMTPSLFPVQGCADNLQAFNNVPSCGNFAGGNNSNLEELVNKGIITEDEYRNKIRKSLGLSTDGASEEEVVDSATEASESLSALSGKTLDKARKSNSGLYKVNEYQTEAASKLIEQVKEILKKDPTEVSEEESEAIGKLFSDLNKNPMVAEAFIKEANETSFRGKNGKTSNLLSSYEQVLKNLHGKDAAKDEISEIRENLEKTLGERNSDELQLFASKYASDKRNVGTSFSDKVKDHPFAAMTAIAGGGAIVSYTAFKTAKAAKKVPGLFPVLAKMGKFGLLTAGIGAVGYSAYKLLAD